MVPAFPTLLYTNSEEKPQEVCLGLRSAGDHALNTKEAPLPKQPGLRAAYIAGT